MKRNRWALRLAALTLVSCLAMSGRFPGGGARICHRSAGDTELSERCVSGTDHDQGRPEDRRPEQSDFFSSPGASGGMSGVREFAVVTLSKGQVLTGDIGCEVMLRVGTAVLRVPLQSRTHRRDYRCLPE